MSRFATIPFDELVRRTILVESGGNPRAVNPRTGAAGLMQIMPDTARQPGFGVAPLDWGQVFDPEANRRFGTEYLRAMLRRYGGDQTRALVAYNWGPGNADRWNGDLRRLPRETRQYVARILGATATDTPARTVPDARMAATAAARNLPDILSGMAQAAPAHSAPVPPLPAVPPLVLPMLPPLPAGGPAFSTSAAAPAATDGLAQALSPAPLPPHVEFVAALRRARPDLAGIISQLDRRRAA